MQRRREEPQAVETVPEPRDVLIPSRFTAEQATVSLQTGNDNGDIIEEVAGKRTDVWCAFLISPSQRPESGPDPIGS